MLATRNRRLAALQPGTNRKTTSTAHFHEKEAYTHLQESSVNLMCLRMRAHLRWLPSQVLHCGPQPSALDGRHSLVVVVGHEEAVDAGLHRRSIAENLREKREFTLRRLSSSILCARSQCMFCTRPDVLPAEKPTKRQTQFNFLSDLTHAKGLRLHFARCDLSAYRANLCQTTVIRRARPPPGSAQPRGVATFVWRSRPCGGVVPPRSGQLTCEAGRLRPICGLLCR